MQTGFYTDLCVPQKMKGLPVYLNFTACLGYMGLIIIIQDQWSSGKWLAIFGYLLFAVIFSTSLISFLRSQKPVLFFVLVCETMGILLSVAGMNHVFFRYADKMGLFLILASGLVHLVLFEVKMLRRNKID